MSYKVKSHLPILEETRNYMVWRTMIQAYLGKTGVWDHVAAMQNALIAAWSKKQNQANGMIILYCSPLVKQGMINIIDPHLHWTHLSNTYGSPGPAGVYVEYHKVNMMRISSCENPSKSIDEMQTIFSYLTANGLTIPDTTQAMTLLGVLPKEWGSFAMTLLSLLATLQMVVNQAGQLAGIKPLTFHNVVPKIQEEWSHHSGESVMPKEKIVKREQNAMQTQESHPRYHKCKGQHPTAEHQDNYKPPSGYQLAPHTKPPQQNKPQAPKGKKGGKKEKGKVRQNQASTSQNLLEGDAFITELDSNDEENGYTSNQAEAGWSTLTPSHVHTGSLMYTVHRDLEKCE